jgi:valyl-tRNA synthetase
MRLVHPIMPFLSEDIWERLPNTSGFVTIAPFPKVQDFPAETGQLDEIEQLQTVITESRRVRADLELARTVPMPFLVSDDGQLALFIRHSRTLAEQAGVTDIAAAGEMPEGGTCVIVLRGKEILIPLEALGVDAAVEVARLDKAIGKAEKGLATLEKRLNNPRFMENAPQEVRDEVREKHRAESTRLEMLKHSRKRAAEGLE